MMIDRLIQVINWIFDTTSLLIKQGKVMVLLGWERVSGVTLRTAGWCKGQLDKRINAEQREKLRIIIDESDTELGRRFDTIMIIIITLSVLVVILETVTEVKTSYWWIFFSSEWFFTVIFTLEYIFRLYSSRNSIKYATSFFGIIDLVSIAPAYLGIFFLGAQNVTVIRALRLLRVFRIFKMGHFLTEGSIIVDALRASRVKISVFISFILLASVLIGSLMYLVEGSVNPAVDNIPKGIYWAIVTLTTVGYGDITPITPFGRFCAMTIMILGYGVIAVPTGIVTAEISNKVFDHSGRDARLETGRTCNRCREDKHITDAHYCHRCGEEFN